MKNLPCLLALAAVCTTAVAGCAKSPATAQRSQRHADFGSAFGNADHTLSGGTKVQYLDVYQLTLPLGAVSRSEEFWKRVDEQSVDIGTYDLLQKNGFRVGVAPSTEWAYFRAILEQYPATTKKTTVSAGDAGALEMLMKKGVTEQNLFYLTDDNRLLGRTYDRCENLLALTFHPAPRRPGNVRVTLCPLVRTTRGQFQISVTNVEREYEYVRPERLYDLNLCCDVPISGFLVVAPSSMAKWTSNLGSAFLVDGGVAERFEHVLIMVPRTTTAKLTGVTN